MRSGMLSRYGGNGLHADVQVTAGMLSSGRTWAAKGELKGGAGPPAADVAEELLEDANCGGSQLGSRCALGSHRRMAASPAAQC